MNENANQIYKHVIKRWVWKENLGHNKWFHCSLIICASLAYSKKECTVFISFHLYSKHHCQVLSVHSRSLCPLAFSMLSALQAKCTQRNRWYVHWWIMRHRSHLLSTIWSVFFSLSTILFFLLARLSDSATSTSRWCKGMCEGQGSGCSAAPGCPQWLQSGSPSPHPERSWAGGQRQPSHDPAALLYSKGQRWSSKATAALRSTSGCHWKAGEDPSAPGHRKRTLQGGVFSHKSPCVHYTASKQFELYCL